MPYWIRLATSCIFNCLPKFSVFQFFHDLFYAAYHNYFYILLLASVVVGGYLYVCHSALTFLNHF